MAVGLCAGCGSGSPDSATGGVTGNTAVTVLVSSTANDRLQQFKVTLTSLSLMNRAGKTVALFSTPQYVELLHRNGTAEPLLTVSVPADTYTAVTATFSYGQFTCVDLGASGGIQANGYTLQTSVTTPVTMNLASPFTVTGSAMGMALDMQVSQSQTYTTCGATGIQPFTITPTFKVAPVDFSVADEYTRETELNGVITVVNELGSSFSLMGADDASWMASVDGSTLFQGVSGLAALTTGMPVDMDVTVRANGSLLATRVELDDANGSNASMFSGALLFVDAIEPALYAFGQEQQGYLFPQQFLGAVPFSFGSSVFRVSGQMSNLSKLPFTASFTAANMVAGQNILLTSHSLAQMNGPTYIGASTMTLVPQTINGTVTSVSKVGGFDVYTLSLAVYDLPPQLAAQGGQTTLLATPGTVQVYADSSAQLRTSRSVAVGSVLRFNGLLFNDHGSLKMDCAWVNDGVDE